MIKENKETDKFLKALDEMTKIKREELEIMKGASLDDGTEDIEMIDELGAMLEDE
jgi:hypothetical protein